MSTRAAIGRTQGDTFRGRYHHHDGYPTALGKIFARQASAAADLRKFLKYVVNEHKGGWSSIWPDNHVCYCHLKEQSQPTSRAITECDLSIEWAYGIDPKTRMMGVFCSTANKARDKWVRGRTTANGLRTRGFNLPGYDTALVAIVDIDDPTTDWEAIEAKGNALKEAAWKKNEADEQQDEQQEVAS